MYLFQMRWDFTPHCYLLLIHQTVMYFGMINFYNKVQSILGRSYNNEKSGHQFL